MRKGSEIRSNIRFEDLAVMNGVIALGVYSVEYMYERFWHHFCGANVFTLVSVLGCFPGMLSPTILHLTFLSFLVRIAWFILPS